MKSGIKYSIVGTLLIIGLIVMVMALPITPISNLSISGDGDKDTSTNILSSSNITASFDLGGPNVSYLWQKVGGVGIGLNPSGDIVATTSLSSPVYDWYKDGLAFGEYFSPEVKVALVMDNEIGIYNDTFAEDLSGNGNDGHVLGTLSYTEDTNGDFGSYSGFSGGNNINSSYQGIGLTEFTFCGWGNTTGNHQTFVSFNVSGVAYEHGITAASSSSVGFRFHLNGGDINFNQGVATFNNGSFHHVCMVFENSTVFGYVNGQHVGNQTGSKSTTDITQVRLGFNDGWNLPWKGEIGGEVLFIEDALSSSEIEEIFNRGYFSINDTLDSSFTSPNELWYVNVTSGGSNYLSNILNTSDASYVSSSDTSIGEQYFVNATPFNSTDTGTSVQSNILEIGSVAYLNSTSGTTATVNDNLTAYPLDFSPSWTDFSYDWYRDNKLINPNTALLSPKLLLPFNTNAGTYNSTFAEDVSPNSVNATVVGATFVSSGSQDDSSYYDFGNNEYMTQEGNYSFIDDGGNFTFMAWVNMSSGSGSRTIFQFSKNQTTANELWFYVDGTTGVLDSQLGNGAKPSSTGSVTFLQWTHVALTKEGDNYTYWIDGQPDTSFVSSVTYEIGNCGLNIGTDSDAGGCHDNLGDYFKGYLDDVFVFSRALTSDEINNIMDDAQHSNLNSSFTLVNEVWYVNITPYNSTTTGTTVMSNNITILSDSPSVEFSSGSPTNGSEKVSPVTIGLETNFSAFNENTPGDTYSFLDLDSTLVNWMNFDTVQSGGNPIDLSTYSFNGSLQNGASIGNFDSPYSNSVYFDGVNDDLLISGLNTAKLDGNLTISFWLNVNSSEAGQNNVILSRSSSGTDRIELYKLASERLNLAVDSGGGVTFSGFNVVANTWHHVTFVYDRTNGNTSLYVNGVFNGSGVSAPSGSDAGFGASFYLGRSSTGGINIHASMDEFVLMNRTISPSEAMSLYNASSTQYTASHNLVVGEHSIKGNVANEEGNVDSTETRQFNITLTPSINITLIEPLNNSYFNQFPTTLFNYTALSENTIDQCYLYVNDTEVDDNLTIINGTNYFSRNNLSDGYQYWNVGCIDELNNTDNSSVFYFTADSTPPQFNITNQSSPFNVNFNYTINATDELGNVSTYTLNDTTNFSINGTTGLVINSSVLDGAQEFYFNVSVNDTLNNTNYTLWFVNITFVDIVNPNVTIINPLNDTINNNVSLDVIVTDNVEINVTQYSLDGLANITFLPNITLGALSDGTHNITVYANDTSGNNGSSPTRYFIVDSTPPNFGNLQNLTNVSELVDFTYDINASDDTSSVDSFTLNDTSVFNINNTGYVTNVSALSSSTQYTLLVSVNDTLNNTNTTVWTITTSDNIDPIVTINLPLNQTYTTDSLEVNISAVDNIAISTILFDWNGTNFTYTTNITTLFTQGEITLLAYANDTSNNWGNDNVTFFVDSIPPNFGNLQNLTNVSELVDFTYDINASDDTSSVDSFTLNDTSVFNINNTGYVTNVSTLSSSTQYTLLVSVNDTLNNTNTTVWTITTIDNINPNVTINSPMNITYNTTNLELNISAVDDIAIDEVWWTIDNGLTNTTYTTNVSVNFPNGQTLLIAYANDTSGNIGNDSLYFNISAELPIVTLNTPLNNAVNLIGDADFFCSVSAGSELSNMSLILNGTINETVNVSGLTNSTTFSKFLADGLYVWSCNATNLLGIEGFSEQRNFTINPLESPIYTNFTGNTTNFSDVPDITRLQNLTLESPSFGQVIFTDIINVSGLDFDTNVTFAIGSLDVNSTGLGFNSPAIIYLYNLGFEYTPIILKDGSICTSSDCTSISYVGNTISFNVSGFTNYSVTNNSQIEVFDDGDNETDEQVHFFANYSNFTSGLPISGAVCNLQINDTTNVNLSFNSPYYEYNKSFPSQGIYGWNVTCSATGYENVTADETINITNLGDVYFISNQTVILTEGDQTNVSLSFNVSSFNPLNDSTAFCSATKNAVVRVNTSCLNTTSNPNNNEFQCVIPLYYFDNYGTWEFECSINDTLGNELVNQTNFTVNQLTAVGQSATSFVWSLAPPTQTVEADDSIDFYNLGNTNFTNLNVTGYDANYTNSTITADNFKLNDVTGSSSGSTSLVNNTSINIPFFNLPSGNGALEGIYAYLSVPNGIENGIYTSINQWLAKIS